MEPISFWKMIAAGGPLMWPIILCSIFALAIIIDKFCYFHRLDRGTALLVKDIAEKARRHEIKEALDVCERSNLPLANVLKVALLNYNRPRTQIKEAVEDAASYEIPRIEKNIPILATIAHVAPLLGFLGTVAGMVSCFQAVELRIIASDSVMASEVIGGIWKALITAIAGLLVAIPVFVAYNYFISRINNVVREMERFSTEFLNLLTE